MITAAQISDIHNKFASMPATADVVLDRNMNELMMFAIDSDHVDFDGDRLTFVQGAGPLKSVEIERICGAQDLGSHIAIVMPASVILVNKTNGAIAVSFTEE